MMWEGDEQAELAHWVAIAGDYTANTGMHLDVKATRIKHSASNSDLDKEGVRLEMTGGRDPFTPKGGQKGIQQKATIELLCNRDKTGWEPDENPAEGKKLRKSDEEGDRGHQDDDQVIKPDNRSAIQFVSYDRESIGNENWDVLRLKWETKYACEDAAHNLPQSEGWGFLTWLIIL
jgi:hypothetical protein